MVSLRVSKWVYKFDNFDFEELVFEGDNVVLLVK